jgi:hypothetical protein
MRRARADGVVRNSFEEIQRRVHLGFFWDQGVAIVFQGMYEVTYVATVHSHVREKI